MISISGLSLPPSLPPFSTPLMRPGARGDYLMGGERGKGGREEGRKGGNGSDVTDEFGAGDSDVTGSSESIAARVSLVIEY